MKVKKLFWTIRYLRPKQIYFRLYYVFKKYFPVHSKRASFSLDKNVLLWDDFFSNPPSYRKNQTFTFLNKEHRFSDTINWNYSSFGKLWTYNLNYFDFLNQEDITKDEGLSLIMDFVNSDNLLKDGLEPYPISLRGINWIKFLSKHSIDDTQIHQVLFNHYQVLRNNLEYHLLGNHLLENGYSLFFGAYYFKDELLYKKSKKVLKAELEEQVLEDGGHFELSPMYHQIVLHRLLDCINLLRLNPWKNDGMRSFLIQKAQNMLSWLEKVTFSNGNIPMVNDSTYGIAPSSEQLFKYAKELGLAWTEGELSDSGYRKFHQDRYELFVDVGDIGPTYQPGHAHSDTFSFELYSAGKPIIVDTGTSTYEKNVLRQTERGTASHNTVIVGNQDQSQVWGGFRVAKRAKITELEEGKNLVKATHDGYKAFGVEHTRSFISHPSEIVIEDEMNKRTKEEHVAFFHFHPEIKEIELEGNRVKLINENINLTFEGPVTIIPKAYMYAIGFNQRVKSQKIEVYFQKHLKTKIEV